MKHIKLFEQLILESDAKVTAMRQKLNASLKQVISQLKDAHAEMEDIEDSGRDPKEIELHKDSIDGVIMSLESKRDKIKQQLDKLYEELLKIC